MTMQRKHYNAIAAALHSGDASQGLIDRISSDLALYNVKFDRAKFNDKAINGPSMEKRAAQYRTQLRHHPGPGEGCNP